MQFLIELSVKGKKKLHYISQSVFLIQKCWEWLSFGLYFSTTYVLLLILFCVDIPMAYLLKDKIKNCGSYYLAYLSIFSTEG